MISAGLVLAQAPDEEPGRGGRAGRRGGRDGRPGMREEHREAMRGVMAVIALLGHESATIENTDDGIDVTVTPEDDVGQLQQQVQEKLQALEQARGELPDRPGDRGRGRGPRQLFGLILRGDIELTARNIDNGVVLSITSDDPEVVQAIQERIPQLQERAGRMRQMRERMQRRREAHELLAQENVTITTEETAEGIAVTVTTENPETEQRIKDLLPEFFEGLQEMPQRDGDGPPHGRMGRRRDRDEEGEEEAGAFRRGRGDRGHRRGGQGRRDGDREDEHPEEEEEDED
jgi:hypothetical protein